jgi:hypothetical protein
LCTSVSPNAGANIDIPCQTPKLIAVFFIVFFDVFVYLFFLAFYPSFIF